MQGSIIVYGSSKKERIEKIDEIAKNVGFNVKKPSTDLLIASVEENKSSIGIEKIREIQKFLSQKPYENNTKLVFIEEAHLLTVQAQNALLKTLEEPPVFATIILECANKNDLLETIISRCQQIYVNSTRPKTGKNPSWEKIKRLSIKEKLNLAEKLTKKTPTEVREILREWLENERENLRINMTEDTKNNVVILGEVLSDIENTNVNLALTIDYLLTQIV